MTEFFNNHGNQLSHAAPPTAAELIEHSMYVSEFDLYLPISSPHKNCSCIKCRLANSIRRGAKFNESAERRHRRVVFNELVKNPLNALGFLLKEGATSSASLLFFSITVSLPFMLNFSSPGNTKVLPAPSLDAEITAEMIANAVPPPPTPPLSSLAPPSDLQAHPPGWIDTREKSGVTPPADRPEHPSEPGSSASGNSIATNLNTRGSAGGTYSQNVVGYEISTNGELKIISGSTSNSNGNGARAK